MFLRDKPVPRDLLDEALALAIRAPSNSNIQPWRLFLTTGPRRDRLVELAAEEGNTLSIYTSLNADIADIVVPAFEEEFGIDVELYRADSETVLQRILQESEASFAGADIVVDPAELELPDLGLILVEDAETGEQLLVDTSDPLLRARLTEQVGAREAEVAAGMSRAGVDAHRITTDQDMLATLVDLVRRSGRRRR